VRIEKLLTSQQTVKMHSRLLIALELDQLAGCLGNKHLIVR
jgi:hypothetical protein